ncbi:FAD dependent oxidoreductase [Emericellopsis atlantica]|uniref:FAD dependent oxidoreductase n=1 Tax=Emericellopsis atlantica TaxID=2614577 RepID=A0A9P8CPR6_9HYPO|nr:FAD dependent oxidoreductase [Emericellopsis atlantica]KAG9254400.1 FAD dependent oxidoreductase [Emericellopsis atlantica]
MPSKTEPIIIVGAGAFGLSLAHELAANRGYTDVTVLDRHLPPVPDGSSVDVSRVIRSEYADPLYASLGREAIEKWSSPEWSEHYHEAGFLIFANGQGHPYFDACLQAAAVNAKTVGKVAMNSPQGGWAHAKNAIASLAERASQAGVTFITGSRGKVVELLKEGSKVKGVRTAGGDTLTAPTVVLATGAWTNRFMPQLEHNLSATGQVLGFIQLTTEEANRYKDVPVMMNLSTGVFTFPPTPDTHQIKIARHGYGYQSSMKASDDRVISCPSDSLTKYIPREAAEALEHGMAEFYPEFAGRHWCNTRLCWYTDTPDGDFLADYHPKIEGLFFATGGSGHAFKFLPVLGRHVADCFERKAHPDLQKKWKFHTVGERPRALVMGSDGSRGGPPLRKLSDAEQAKL